MFGEYEESLEWFLASLSTTNPDKFTDLDWQLIRTYTRSDGCSGVSDWHVKACWEHDFYFRTHHDFEGKVISFSEANLRFLRRLFKLSWLSIFNLRAYIRWLGVTVLGKNAWNDQRHYQTHL